MKITVNDAGILQTVNIDDQRYAQFDSLRHNPTIRQWVGDAQEGLAFLVSQLAYTENRVFNRLYTPMQYEQLLPISFEAGEWAETIRYEIYDHVGQGRRISGKDRAVPKVDIAVADKSMPVFLAGIGYDYSQEELRKSAHLRRSLPTLKLAAAIEAYRRHLNQVGLFGEAESNITGLYNNASVPKGNAPTGSWATATEAQILADINTAIMNVWTNTAFNDMPDHVVMAPGALALLAVTPRATQSDTTLLKFIKENNIAKVQRNIDVKFEPGFGLDTAGVGTTRRLIAYVKSEDRLVFHVPMPLRFQPPQPVGLSIDILGEYKYSGVEVRYPKSMYYMDNI